MSTTDANTMTEQIMPINNNNETNDSNTSQQAESNPNSATNLIFPTYLPNLIPYNPAEGMAVSSWLEYFDCNAPDDETWKLNNISSFLKGDALKTYVNEALHITDWKTLQNLLIETFMEPKSVSFNTFTNLRFHNRDDLTHYFRKKLQTGRHLGLPTELILQGLTDGLPTFMQTAMVGHEITSTTQWLTLANKLHQINPQQQQYPSFRPQFRPPNYQSNWNSPRNFAPRQQATPFRSQGPQTRPFFNSHARFQGPRFNRPPTTNTSHCQEQTPMPPSPCKWCEKLGVYNAFHWMSACPFKPDNPVSRPPSQATTPGDQTPDPPNQE